MFQFFKLKKCFSLGNFNPTNMTTANIAQLAAILFTLTIQVATHSTDASHLTLPEKHTTQRTPTSHFLVEPIDVVVQNPDEPIVLTCLVNFTVDRCDWLQGGQQLYLDTKKYQLPGDTAGGDCSLHVLKPQIGVDTTFWQCNPLLDNFRRILSKPARVLVLNGTGTGNVPQFNWTMTILVDAVNSNKRVVLLDGKTGHETRVRWYINGRLQTAASKRWLDGNLFDNELAITIKKDPVLVQCCVEFKYDVLFKEVFVASAFIIDNNYTTSVNKCLDRLPFDVQPPKIRLSFQYNGKEQQITDNRLIIRAKDIQQGDFRIFCVDAAASVSTYLRWGLIDPLGNAEVTNELIEFSDGEKDSGGKPEKISAHVRFLIPNHHISLQCQAENILHKGISRSSSAVITVRLDDPCFAAKHSSRGINIK